MTTPAPQRRIGRPRKVVTDAVRAEQILEDLRALEHHIRESSDRRKQLMLEAAGLGVTVTKIGEATGTSPATVSQRLRSARTSST